MVIVGGKLSRLERIGDDVVGVFQSSFLEAIGSVSSTATPIGVICELRLESQCDTSPCVCPAV